MDARIRRCFWTLVFVAIVVLNVDWWWWDRPLLIGGWFPGWIAYSVALQLMLALALYRFGRGRCDG